MRAKVTYTPQDEPYLGRQMLKAFDEIISACLEYNSKLAPRTHQMNLSDLQHAACQLIPQTINIALSIRELIRQGYLFGAMILVRPLVERAMILLYLHERPDEIGKWNRGWTRDEAPSLARMFDIAINHSPFAGELRGHQLTKILNDLLHGKPECAVYSMIAIDGGRFGHTASKIIDNPSQCDEICANVLPWMAFTISMMGAYFPDQSDGAKGEQRP